jgi:formate dehydrogenase major subunit
MGHDWGAPDPEQIWTEVRRLSPVHAGLSYERLEANHGLQWPCWDESHPGELFLHSRLWERPVPGPRAAFQPVEQTPPVDVLDNEFPLRLTTGRRLDEYNTGVQTSGYASPMRDTELFEMSPEDADRYGFVDGELVRVRSRRGEVVVPVRRQEGLKPGLTFMTLHFPDDVATNMLTIEAPDPKSGTTEFKATAVCVERVGG